MTMRVLGNDDEGSEGGNVMTAPRYRTFVNVKEPFTSYQVKEGDPELNKPMASPEGGYIQPLIRTGDKFVIFQDGVFGTDDEDCIKFCENHPDIMDMEAAETEILVPLLKLEVPRADYEPETSVSAANIVQASMSEVVKREVRKALIARGLNPDE